MRKQISGVIAAVGLIVWSFVSSAQTSGYPGYRFVDVLVWGAEEQIDAKAYSPKVKTELAKHYQRWQRYRSKRVRPTTHSREMAQGYSILIRYERRLVAVSDDP